MIWNKWDLLEDGPLSAGSAGAAKRSHARKEALGIGTGIFLLEIW
jgi:hypothetical protein